MLKETHAECVEDGSGEQEVAGGQLQCFVADQNLGEQRQHQDGRRNPGDLNRHSGHVASAVKHRQHHHARGQHNQQPQHHAEMLRHVILCLQKKYSRGSFFIPNYKSFFKIIFNFC
jgi:hypothetical protein